MTDRTDAPEPAAYAQLIARARAGDQAAFASLCTRQATQRWLVMIALLLPQRLRAKVDPEDILQETLTRAWCELDALRADDAAGFFRWVAGIARHVAADASRRFSQQKRDSQREEGFARAPDSGAFGASHTPSRSVARREEADRLVALLDELSEPYRAVIMRRILEGCSTQETAEALETSVENVSVLLHRALRKVRTLMEERGLRSTVLRVG